MPNTNVSTDFTLYTNKGLTWISDLPYVNTRDSAGNIILYESSSNNSLLIIDAVNYNFTVDSVNKQIDTRFEFFEFPVSTTIVDSDFTLNTDLPFTDDSTSKKFIIPSIVDTNGQLSTYRRIGTSYETDWFYNGTQKQKGFTRIPFQTDNGEGSYEITPEILKTAKSKNQVIKFTVFVQATSAWRDEYNIDPKGWNTSFQMSIGRTEIYDAWESWNNTDKQPLIYTEDSGRLGNDPKTGQLWLVKNADGTIRKDSNGNTIPTAGLFGENDYPGMYIEYIIDPSIETAGRKYFIQISAGSPSWILSDTCRWDINLIDKPVISPIWSPIPKSLTGVYNIGNKTRLETGTRKQIATKINDQVKYSNGKIYSKTSTNVVTLTSSDSTVKIKNDGTVQKTIDKLEYDTVKVQSDAQAQALLGISKVKINSSNS